MSEHAPAFPYQVQGPTTGPEISCGMDLRDYFAARIAPALLTDDLEVKMLDEVDKAAIAHETYLMADAMLKERSK